MPKFPFTYFDYFAYLVVGFPIIWVLGHASESTLEVVITPMSTTEKWIFAIITAFLLGQITSFLAHNFFQEKVVVFFLGRPSDNLLECSKKSSRKAK